MEFMLGVRESPATPYTVCSFVFEDLQGLFDFWIGILEQHRNKTLAGTYGKLNNLDKKFLLILKAVMEFVLRLSSGDGVRSKGWRVMEFVVGLLGQVLKLVCISEDLQEAPYIGHLETSL